MSDRPEYEAEAARRWPDTYEVARQRRSQYGAEELSRAVADGDAIAARFGELMAAGEPATGAAAMTLAEQHRLSIDRWYYPCSREMHSGLADMYLADRRFTEYWENRAEGLTQYVHDAIWANALQ